MVVSPMEAEIINGEDLFLRLSGNVSTKSNGGFIQVRSSRKSRLITFQVLS